MGCSLSLGSIRGLPRFEKMLGSVWMNNRSCTYGLAMNADASFNSLTIGVILSSGMLRSGQLGLVLP